MWALGRGEHAATEPPVGLGSKVEGTAHYEPWRSQPCRTPAPLEMATWTTAPETEVLSCHSPLWCSRTNGSAFHKPTEGGGNWWERVVNLKGPQMIGEGVVDTNTAFTMDEIGDWMPSTSSWRVDSSHRLSLDRGPCHFNRRQYDQTDATRGPGTAHGAVPSATSSPGRSMSWSKGRWKIPTAQDSVPAHQKDFKVSEKFSYRKYIYLHWSWSFCTCMFVAPNPLLTSRVKD